MSVRRRLRLFSQAVSTPRRDALEGSTLLTMKTSSRRPAMASATTVSAPPRRTSPPCRSASGRDRCRASAPRPRRRGGAGPRPSSRCPGRAPARARPREVLSVLMSAMATLRYCAISDLGRGRSSSSDRCATRMQRSRKQKTRRIAPAGFVSRMFAAVAAKAYFLRFFSAAPRMSPSEAPESVEPYWATASFSSAISSALIDTVSLRVFLS